MEDVVIGIDLGTTYSSVAYFYDNNLKILENNEGTRITPSFVFYTEKYAPIVGDFAKPMSLMKTNHGIYDVKRLVGRTFDDPCVRKSLEYLPFKVESDDNNPVIVIEQPSETLKITPRDVCTLILRKLKTDVESKLGHPVNKVVITVPAYFNVTQRKVTLEAATRAGFTVLKLLNEPTAAAITHHFQKKIQDGGYSLVYDLGGGTFDVAVLKTTDGDIEFVSLDGDTHLGGRDFDNLIMDYVCEELQTRYKFNPKAERRSLRRIQDFCEAAKKALGVVEEIPIVLEGIVKDHDVVEINLTRSHFETMADSLIQTTVKILDECLARCNLSETDIGTVILAGGSTRILKIQQVLSEYFGGKTLSKFVNPDECVAEGAALQAAMLSDNPHQKIQGMKVTDVTPLSLGVDDFLGTMDFVIPRNTPIPVSKSVGSVTVRNRQSVMTFNIYEGERQKAEENRHLGLIYLFDLTPAPPGQCVVTLTMSIDKSGILAVNAKEECRDNSKDLKISYTAGHRSDLEVKNIVEDAKTHEEEDGRFLMASSKKFQLFHYCNRMIYNLESRNLVASNIACYDKCKNLKREVERTNVEDEELLEQMMEELREICLPVLQEHNLDSI